MAIQQVLQIGDRRLKRKAKEIDFKDIELIERLVRDMKDTMQVSGLIGIAAPQIGESWRMFVTEPRETPSRPADQTDEFRVYINPKIVEVSQEETEIYEGCGSVLQGRLFGPVVRPREIVVESWDESGKKFRLKCDGILARVILHEYDHLEGVEFTEKVCDYSQLMSYEHYVEQVKNSKKQVEASRISRIEME